MRVIPFCALLLAACSALHVEEDEDDGVWANSSSYIRQGVFIDQKCPEGTPEDGVASASLILRYPSGWFVNYDRIVSAVYEALDEVLESYAYLSIVNVADGAFICRGSTFSLTSTRMNILTLRVCGVPDAGIFCQCLLGYTEKKNWAMFNLCKHGLPIVQGGVAAVTKASSAISNTLSSWGEKLGFAPGEKKTKKKDLISELKDKVEPKIEAMIQKQVLKHGLFSGTSGQDLIALTFVDNADLPKWQDDKAACQSAKALVGDGENNIGATDKEQLWKERRPKILEEIGEEKAKAAKAAIEAKEQQKKESKEDLKKETMEELAKDGDDLPPMCASPDRAEKLALGKLALIGAFGSVR